MPDRGKQKLKGWTERAGRELKGEPPDSLVWNTPEGSAVKPL